MEIGTSEQLSVVQTQSEQPLETFYLFGHRCQLVVVEMQLLQMLDSQLTSSGTDVSWLLWGNFNVVGAMFQLRVACT